jgi:hypothetical protein
MLPRLLDTAGFQSAANMSPDEFQSAALAGMVPRAIGSLANVPVWQEHIVQAFCKEAGREFNSEWSNGGGASAALLGASSHAAASFISPPPIVSERESMDWPEEMTQAMAARYCECSGAFLDKHKALLNSRKEGGFVIYTKADLDAFMELPLYKYRKRFGYSAGKPNGKPRSVHRKPKGITAPAPIEPKTVPHVLLSEKGAADHLGIHPEALAIARHDGIGPAHTMTAGKPCYRVSDLTAWKAEQDRTAPPAKAADAGELDAAAAADYLGVGKATMQYWRTNQTGPAFRKEGTSGRGVCVFYRIADLEQFKRTHSASIIHSQRMRANPNVAGPVPTTRGGHKAKAGKSQSAAAKKQRINGNARAAAGRVASTRTHGAGAKAVTPSGSRLRH